jgi:hypothetical protein
MNGQKNSYDQTKNETTLGVVSWKHTPKELSPPLNFEQVCSRALIKLEAPDGVGNSAQLISIQTFLFTKNVCKKKKIVDSFITTTKIQNPFRQTREICTLTSKVMRPKIKIIQYYRRNAN